MAEYIHTGKWKKMHAWKMTERKMHDTENGRTENAQHGKWQNMHILENGRKSTPGKWQNGKCTTWKMAENTYTGKRQKLLAWKMTEWKMHDPENGRTENA